MTQRSTRLRRERIRRGLTQTALAYAAGMSAPELSRIENGWATPYPGQAERLARALGITQEEANRLGEEEEEVRDGVGLP